MEYGKKERIGGFDLLKFKRNEMTFIKVSNVMGNWSMEYREDCVMFRWLDSERTKEQTEAIHVLIVNTFMAATFVEADFQHDILVAASALQERINNDAMPLSDEEDMETVKNMETEHKIMEYLLNGEEGKADATV